MRKRTIIAVFFAAIILALPITSVSGSREALDRAERAGSGSMESSISVEDFEEMLLCYTQQLENIDPSMMAPEEVFYVMHEMVGEVLEALEDLEESDDSGTISSNMMELFTALYQQMNPVGDVDCGSLLAAVTAAYVAFIMAYNLCITLLGASYIWQTLAAAACATAAFLLGVLMTAISVFLAAGCPAELIANILAWLNDHPLPGF